MRLKIGFIGTGEITAAIVKGLCSSQCDLKGIWLSPRNEVIAADLARRFEIVSVASSNQQVLDSCDVIVVAVKPAIAGNVLAELRFRPDHLVISLVPTLSAEDLRKLAGPAKQVVRAVPLPSAAKRAGVTAIFPPDDRVEELFCCVGDVFAVKSEAQLEAVSSATATASSFYAWMDTIAEWLSTSGTGIDPKDAKAYVSSMYAGMMTVSAGMPDAGFSELAAKHSTRGGLNEQLLGELKEKCVFENLWSGLDEVLSRIRKETEEREFH